MAATRKPAKRRQPGRKKILELLHAQATRALAGDWSMANELRELATTARHASWKARSIVFRGVRFPIRRGLLIDSVRCPDSGRALVGVVT